MSINLLKATLGKDKLLVFEEIPEINEGENLSTSIQISVPQEFSGYEFYLEFYCPDGKKFITPKLEIHDNTLSYRFENSILKRSGQVYAQLSAYDPADRRVLFKSVRNNLAAFKVNKSINSSSVTYNSIDFIGNAQNVLQATAQTGAYAQQQGDYAHQTAETLQQKAKNGEFNGSTPVIGENGNWFVDGKDTQKPSRGEKGSQGERGEQGEKGETGQSLRLCGAWMPNTDYGLLDLVTFDHSAYVCGKAHRSGTSFDSSKWQVASHRGDRGEAGRTWFAVENLTQGAVSLTKRRDDLYPRNVPVNVGDYLFGFNGCFGTVEKVDGTIVTYSSGYRQKIGSRIFRCNVPLSAEATSVSVTNLNTSVTRGTLPVGEGDYVLSGSKLFVIQNFPYSNTGAEVKIALLADFQGEKGDVGSQGADGKQGERGFTPYVGENENWFVNGEDTGKPSRGARGEQGEQGVRGEQGLQGERGFTPYVGSNGNWFVNGEDTGNPSRGERGEQGEKGEQGKEGAVGKAAGFGAPTVVAKQFPAGSKPAVAISTGGLNTAKIFNFEFGIPKGDKGDAGPQGIAGRQGERGYTPYVGSNGNWFINGEDTGKPSRGERGEKGSQGERGETGPQGKSGTAAGFGTPTVVAKQFPAGSKPTVAISTGGLNTAKIFNFEFGIPKGDKGDPGPQGIAGRQGESGYTPYVGSNGNWFINGEDTGKPARGERGEKGSQGERGETGPQGKSGTAAGFGTPTVVAKQFPAGSKPAVAISTGGLNSAKIFNFEFGIPKGDKGDTGPQGVPGPRGQSGVTFTPSVNARGDLSWTNNGGLENPATVNIKGPKGDAGLPDNVVTTSSVNLGNAWTIAVNGSTLEFRYNGSAKLTLTSDGILNLT